MAVYPKKVESRAFAPQHRASNSNEAVSGRSASFVCGCFVSFSLEIESEQIEPSFETNGCGYMIASAEILSMNLRSAKLSDLHGLKSDEWLTAIAIEIDSLPPDRLQCTEVCFEALRSAFASLRERRIEEFRGEDALICTCFGVSESRIEEFVASRPDASVESIADSMRAGSGCGSCRMLIQEMIDSVDPK